MPLYCRVRRKREEEETKLLRIAAAVDEDER